VNCIYDIFIPRYNTKLLKTGVGSIELDAPRDGNSDFSLK
jgi:hypothetical protein